MLAHILSVGLMTAGQADYQRNADLEEGRAFAAQLVAAYANHPEGDVVMDYFTCHQLHMADNNVLFMPSAPGRAIRGPGDIWDIDLAPGLIRSNWRNDWRTDFFWKVVNAYVNAEVLTRLGEIGVDRCHELLAEYEFDWDNIPEPQDEGNG